ncbi:Major facilitator super domain-containing protein 3 [Schistosoma haematobium]|uniref:Major facilitator super domain-containing protein 3 n=1 Tax=Schistosoma haematobium TaxID=6185 RepID=A0A922LUV0_SCHHA|nr:Major facilitator super domain-containing protein 3 [Schistosoma haematobium]KAH9594159.1 Major facilitator super domain-containing protein 3 [Schistosoma haematobium]
MLPSRFKKLCTCFTSYKDIPAILLLILLYVFQGISIGISASIPFLLQSNYRTGGYNLQATFSISAWPFAMKLLWAPIVDSIYVNFTGKRKTWLIITQYTIGIELIVLASRIDDWFGRDPNKAWSQLGSHHPVDIIPLTITFFVLTFLTATQDVAVDGWALTLLSKKNVGLASTCNKVGQSLGYALSFIPLVCLESPDIPNKYLRRTPIADKGLITFSGFLYAWGFGFMIFNTVLVIFKHEKGSKLDGIIRHFVKSRLFSKSKYSTHSLNSEQTANKNEQTDGSEKVSLLNTYKTIIGVIQLKPVALYLIMIVSAKVCAFGTYTATNLKLIEQGFAKEKLALLNLGFVPMEFILPLLFVRFTTGPKPLTSGLMIFLPRLLTNCLFIPIIHFIPHFRMISNDTLMMNNSNMTTLNNYTTNNINNHTIILMKDKPTYSFPLIFYAILISGFLLDKITAIVIFVQFQAFNAKISDPVIGGTYMTLLNTVSNLAGALGTTVSLALIERLTIHSCTKNASHSGIHTNTSGIFLNSSLATENTTCYTLDGNNTCINPIESCVKVFDGYYIEVIALFFIGLILFIWFLYPTAKYLQSLPATKFSYNPTTDEYSCFGRKFNCCRKTENQSLDITDNFESMENNADTTSTAAVAATTTTTTTTTNNNNNNNNNNINGEIKLLLNN